MAPSEPTRIRWRPPLLLVHGVSAIGSMYLFGWIGARHVLRWWAVGLRRWSGGMLATFLALLILSGFALFFVSSDVWQRYAAGGHDVLGIGITLFAIQHWFFGKRHALAAAKETNGPVSKRGRGAGEQQRFPPPASQRGPSLRGGRRGRGGSGARLAQRRATGEADRQDEQ